MKIKDISPAALRGVKDQELLSLHLRTHQLYGANFGPDAPPERGYRDEKGDTAKDGLRLDEETARKIWRGEVKAVTFSDDPGDVERALFLLSPGFAYGVIRLDETDADDHKYKVDYFRAFEVPLTFKGKGDGLLVTGVEITSEESPLSLEDLVHAHQFILDEMARRKMRHQWASQLDDETSPGEEVSKAHGPFMRYGGSATYAEKIAKYVPANAGAYIEPFAGAASVFFSLTDPPKKRVLADLDSEVIHAFKMIQGAAKNGLIKALEKKDRVVGEKQWKRLRNKIPSGDIERVHRFLYLLGGSWSGVRSRSKPNTRVGKVAYNPKRLEKFIEPLQGVTLKNQNWQKTLKDNDAPDAFFFIDPPYPGEWDNNADDTDTSGRDFDVDALVEAMKGLKGGWLLVLGDTKTQTDALAKLEKEAGASRFKIRLLETTHSGGRKEAYRYFAMRPLQSRVRKADDAGVSRDQVLDLMDEAGSFVVVPSYVSLVGSVVTGEDDQQAHDIDLLVRDDEIDSKVGLKLDRLFPAPMRDKVHYIPDPQGPNWDHLPLYDLVLRKRGALEVVEVDEPEYHPFPSGDARRYGDPVAKGKFTIVRGIWGSPGGKAFLARRIATVIPPHKVYVEPFAGGGAVLFAKPPVDKEVVNDLDSEIAFAWRFASKVTDAQLDALRKMNWTASGTLFKKLRDMKPPADPVERFHRFMYLYRWSINGNREKTHTMPPTYEGLRQHAVEAVERCRERVHGLIVRSADYEKVIDEFDSKDTFFFIDPPYKHYDAQLTEEKKQQDFDEDRFVEVLKKIKGKFLVTYGIRSGTDLFKGFTVQRWQHRGRPGAAVGGKFQKVTTLMVSNYPLPQRTRKAKVGLMQPFTPLKAKGGYHQGEFFEADPLWDLWAGPAIKDGKTVAVETKFDGIRMVIHKEGDDVAIYTEDRKRDRASILPDLVEEVRKLSVENAILDAEVVWWRGGKPLARHDMMALVVGKDPIKGEDIRANVFDVLWFGGEGSLADESWEDRQSYLRKVLPKDGKHLKRVVPRLAGNRREFDAALKAARRAVGSEGAMLKLTDAPYDLEGRTGAWAKLKDVYEIKCVVIGVRKKIPSEQEDPGFKKDPSRWSYAGIKEPSAFTYRCAVRGEGGKLVPIEGERTYTDSDLKVRWVEKGKKDPVTGEVASESEWRGTDDPKLWKMGLGFNNRDVGDIEYGTTYGTGVEAKIGDVITVSPVLVREWVGDRGRRHYSWTFPIVREADPTSDEPDRVEDLRRIAAASRQRAPEKTPSKDAVEAAAVSKSAARIAHLQKQRRGDLDPDETKLSREEERERQEKITGDPYMVEQKGKAKARFVLQQHYRGFWSQDELKQLRDGIARARKLAGSDEKDEAKDLLKGLWLEYNPLILKVTLAELREAAEAADDAGEGEVSPAVTRRLSEAVPLLDDLEGIEGRVVNRGNVHTDLRMESPAGDWLIGWTLDTPKLALQTLDGKAHDLLRSYVLDNKPDDNALAQRKLVQPENWLTIVSEKKPIYRTAPGDVGSTRGTAGEYHYVDSGVVIFGVQKSDYHEYFFFPEKNKGWAGRWGLQLIEGSPSYTRAPSEFWMANRPKDTQTPYIQTHDLDEEGKKAKTDKVELVWNPDTVEALKAVGYESLADVSKSAGGELEPISVNVRIVKAAKEERYILGVVMKPDDVDAHGEVTTVAEIRKAAHNFLVNGPKIGYQHEETPGGLILIESFLAPAEFKLGTETIAVGTWLIAVRVINNKVWKAVKEGKITGFSIEGYAKKVPLA